VVRTANAGIALGFLLLALTDKPVLHAGALFGGFQAAMLAAGVCLAALCFAPLAWNQKVLTVLVSVGLSLVLAEFMLRAALGPRFLGISQRDDRVLYRLVPGAERINVLPPFNGGTVIRYRINSQGFRGAELAPAGRFARVVVYGDSFIQADFSRSQDTFTEQLRGQLTRKLGRAVEVVNAGVAGYGPDQELRRMEEELPALKPNLVIVAIYAGNDFGDLLRHKLYLLSSAGSLRENHAEFLDADIASEMQRSRSEPILRKIVRAARQRLLGDPGTAFVTGREARRARVDADLRQGIAEYRQYVLEGDNAVHTLYVSPYNADVSLMPGSESARYKISMMEQIMQRMGETAARNNAALMFLLIPSPIDATDVHEAGEVDAAKYPEYRRSTLTDILEQICQRNHFREVNLFPAFWQRRADDLYLKGWDDHWNARGQAYAAQLVGEFVVAQSLLGAPNVTGGAGNARAFSATNRGGA
jgi:lysophospholipase L1-like esterase